MKYLSNTIHIPATFCKLWFSVKKQKSFITDTLIKDFDTINSTNDGSINNDDLKKITDYYGLGVPAILGESFALLRGHKLSLKERTASTYIGAMTGLGDDFFDLKDLSDDDLKLLLHALLNNPEEVKVKRLSENLFLQFYIKVLANIETQNQLKKYIYEVFKAQIMSLKQVSENLSNNEILEITRHKGGVSLLLYRSIFSHELSDEESKMLYNLGGLMQISNDIFDVYKDSQKGIKTLTTTTTDIGKLRNTFRSIMDETFNMTYNTKYSHKNIKKFLRFISMGICRTYVCLDQLEKLQKTNSHIFEPSKYQRKELICDMEKPKNMIKSISYYVKYDLKKNNLQ